MSVLRRGSGGVSFSKAWAFWKDVSVLDKLRLADVFSGGEGFRSVTFVD